MRILERNVTYIVLSVCLLTLIDRYPLATEVETQLKPYDTTLQTDRQICDASTRTDVVIFE